MINRSPFRNDSITLSFIFMFCILSGQCARSVPTPADFKVSFIPEPWEVNVERDYLLLDDGWKFFKGAPVKIKDIEAAAEKISNPSKFTLRDGSVVPNGAKCDKPQDNSCDDASWVTMRVPFNWSDLGPDMDRFVGTAWYRKYYEVDEKQLSGRRALLHFEGAFYRAWVYVNGERAGMHEGGYTPFTLDVTELLKPGANLLAVRVSNEIGADDIQIGDWWNYGGIHRDVFLEFVNETFIRDLYVRADPNENLTAAEVTVALDVSGAGADSAVAYFFKLDGENKTLIHEKKININSAGMAAIKWKMDNPQLWSPESPNLYFVKCVLVRGGAIVDGAGDMFGVRRFEIRGTAIYLNNREIFLRGINRHDEFFHGAFPDAGRVGGGAARVADFQLIKDMRANAMRTGHYPNHRANYYIADRIGIIVIEEGGSVRAPHLDAPEYIAKINNQMREMILRDRNHASILVWSIGNEFGGDEFIRYIEDVAAYTRALDGRPITFTETGGQIVKRGYAFVDILSRNEYAGWYGISNPGDKTPAELRDYILPAVRGLLDGYHADFPDMPVIIMETGAESVCGQHAAAPGVITARGDEEYQELVLKYQFEEILNHDYVVGVVPWLFADFKTRRASGTCQFTPHFNRKGLVCADRSRKRAFDLVRQVYQHIEEKQQP